VDQWWKVLPRRSRGQTQATRGVKVSWQQKWSTRSSSPTALPSPRQAKALRADVQAVSLLLCLERGGTCVEGLEGAPTALALWHAVLEYIGGQCR
jgi:hypothetical protein